MEIVIIGGGASGLMCAGIIAEQSKHKVILLEKMEKCGRKIRISGKGKCNLTNMGSQEDFITHIHPNNNFIKQSLRFFNVELRNFFSRIGVETCVERGNRVFPKSSDAWEVANKLEKWVRQQGVEIRLHHKVTNLSSSKNKINSITIQTPQKRTTMQSDIVVIATGGKSYPATGSTGDAYPWITKMNHKLVPIRPSLVGCILPELSKYNLRKLELKNIEITVQIEEEKSTTRGDILLDKTIIGGSLILKHSRKIVDALYSKNKVTLAIDLKPALSIEKLTNRCKRESETCPTLTVRTVLHKLLPSPLIPLYIDHIGLPPNTSLSPSSCQHIAQKLKNLTFSICQTEGFDRAVVTAGGVDTSQIDPQTMKSLLIPNLYFVGEVLDIDGDTGGYNLQCAFSTAFCCGSAIAKIPK